MIDYLAVTPADLAQFPGDPGAAVVLAYARFRDQVSQAVTRREIVKVTAMTKKQVRRLTDMLCAEGHLIAYQVQSDDRVNELEFSPAEKSDPAPEGRPPAPEGISLPIQVTKKEITTTSAAEETMSEVTGQMNILGEEEIAEQKVRSTGQEFEQWWKTYPTKAGKAMARKAWQKATRRCSPAELTLLAHRYTLAFNWWNDTHPDHQQKPIHASTFLNSKFADFEDWAGPEAKAIERWGFLTDPIVDETPHRYGPEMTSVRDDDLLYGPSDETGEMEWGHIVNGKWVACARPEGAR